MKKCANCGNEIDDSRNWCEPCVHRLVAENDNRKRDEKRRAMKIATWYWFSISLTMVVLTDALGTMLVPVVMGIGALPAYAFYRLELL